MDFSVKSVGLCKIKSREKVREKSAINYWKSRRKVLKKSAINYFGFLGSALDFGTLILGPTFLIIYQ